MTVVVDAASVDRVTWLVVASVSASTRRQSDMRGLVTAGRTVRLEWFAGLDIELGLGDCAAGADDAIIRRWGLRTCGVGDSRAGFHGCVRWLAFEVADGQGGAAAQQQYGPVDESCGTDCGDGENRGGR